jgi:hypothetical protein
MAKKQVAPKGASREETSSVAGEKPATAAAQTPEAKAAVGLQENAPEVKVHVTAPVLPAPRQRAVPPEGWVKLPLEVRPFWTPLHSKRPLQGLLISQARLEVEGIPVLEFRLSAETDVLLPTGQLAVARVNQHVLVPQFYGLNAIAQLLSRQDLYYHVFLGNPELVDLGTGDAGASTKIWSFDAVVNPQGIPRAPQQPPQPQQPQQR